MFGVGGDKVVVKQSGGLRGDDEAFKKAFTDGITNALKMIGVGADVHMGMFDDDKYVNSLREEFAEDDGSDNRKRYVRDCRAKIAAFPDQDPRIRPWWDGEAQARRDFGLSNLEVNELKELVIAKLPKKAAAA